MTLGDLVVEIHDAIHGREIYDDPIEIYIASTILMPLSQINFVHDPEELNSIILVQQRNISSSNPLTVFNTRQFFDKIHGILTVPEVLIMAAYLREIEKVEVHTVADMKKQNENRSVAIKDAWDVHPVDESTVREVLIIYTPL